MAPEPSVTVCAIDPGERVGYAVGQMRTNQLEVVKHGVLPLKEFALQLSRWQGVQTGLHDFDALVYETWRLRPAVAKAFIGNDMQPSQVVGMVRLIGWLSGAKLVGYGPEKKMVAQATMPSWFASLKDESNEEHNKDALDLLWHHYYALYHDPTEAPTNG